MDGKFYTNERNQQILISLLKAHGIKKIVASPGTTNYTFVGSIQQDSWFEIYSSVDERSAAYIACGLSAESGEPVVLTCTGATASRNYMSGLTEAFYRKLPIVAITANQGTNLVGHLIAQNIDRSVIPNDIAKLSVNIPFCKDKDDEWNCEILINKALLELNHNGRGPVHINIATQYSRDFSVQKLPTVRFINRVKIGDCQPPMPVGRIAIFIGAHRTFSIDDESCIDDFCSSNNAVVICDHTSGYYGKYRVSYSLIGSQKQYDSDIKNIDLLIHFGEVSGDYDHGINAKNVWRVNEDGEIRDSFRRLTCVFEMSERQFLKLYTKEFMKDDSFLHKCKDEYRTCYDKIPKLPFSNVWIAKQMSSIVPENSVLHLGILNTLRSWNFFEINSNVKTYSNVGGFGIDGVISTLLGSSLASPKKIHFCITGDLAFFYDMNSLGNRHVNNNLRILLINNGRGTEFRNYNHPCSQFGEIADQFMAAAGHYGNKSKFLVRNYAENLGFEYFCASNKDEFLRYCKNFLSPELAEKPKIFEVFTDSSEESKALHLIHNCIINKKQVKYNKIKNVIKSISGENTINLIKKIIK